MASARVLATILGAAACLIGGMTQAVAAAEPEHGHLHHVHLNVTDVAKTSAFYQKTFGVVPVSYAGRAPALMAERTFILMDQKAGPIPTQLETGVIHIGWAGVDGPSEFANLQKQGVEFYTPLTPFLGGHFMYLYGPDREVVEIWTVEKHHRLNHVHMPTPDPKATAEWFAKVTNSPSPAQGGPRLAGTWLVNYGDVTLHMLADTGASHPKERTGPLQPTDGRGIDHLAFAFQNLDAAYARVKAQGVPIERPISIDPTYGFRHFFVRSPEGVLVEMLQAKSLPDAAWQ